MRRRKPRTRIEPTIALINIVFLMLVFFMVASTLAQPLDPDLNLVRTADLQGREPPDTLVVHPDGRLSFRGQEIASAQVYYDTLPTAERDTIRVVPDAALSGIALVDLAKELRVAGAARVVIVTEKGVQ